MEYGGVTQLLDTTWNYRNNRARVFGNHEDTQMSYEKALRNLIVFMFGHYINSFECHRAWKRHQAILTLECFMVADELGRYHHWYKRVDLTRPRIRQTWWKDLLQDPQDDSHSSYCSALAAMGDPKQPSYGHPKLLGWYFNHMYHQSQNIGHLTQKAWDKTTDYNESVYNCELNELISHLRGVGDLDFSTRHQLEPMSLLNPEIILPEAAFQAAHRKKKGWIDKSWTCGGEKLGQYSHNDLEARLDWNGKPEELEREKDAIDEIDHEAMYLDDYQDDIPDLEESKSVSNSVYDQLGVPLLQPLSVPTQKQPATC